MRIHKLKGIEFTKIVTEKIEDRYYLELSQEEFNKLQSIANANIRIPNVLADGEAFRVAMKKPCPGVNQEQFEEWALFLKKLGDAIYEAKRK